MVFYQRIGQSEVGGLVVGKSEDAFRIYCNGREVALGIGRCGADLCLRLVLHRLYYRLNQREGGVHQLCPVDETTGIAVEPLGNDSVVDEIGHVVAIM